MSVPFYVVVLLGSTVVLSALWAAVLLVLVRIREEGVSARPAEGSHLGVEIAWAVIPAVMVLSVVVPALQSGWNGGSAAVLEAPALERVAEAPPAP